MKKSILIVIAILSLHCCYAQKDTSTLGIIFTTGYGDSVWRKSNSIHAIWLYAPPCYDTIKCVMLVVNTDDKINRCAYWIKGYTISRHMSAYTDYSTIDCSVKYLSNNKKPFTVWCDCMVIKITLNLKTIN